MSVAATLDPVLVIEERTLQVHYVSNDGQIPPGMIRSGLTILFGELANLLYMALAGHAMDDSPFNMHPVLARSARASLARRRVTGEAGIDLINEVINNWGEYIRPWLGAKLIDQAGEPIENLPAYRSIVWLTDSTIEVAEDYYFGFQDKN